MVEETQGTEIQSDPAGCKALHFGLPSSLVM